MPVVFGIRYWSRVARTLLARHHLPDVILLDGDTLSRSAPIANTASAYAPPALGMNMRPMHKDSSPACTAMTSHMPRAYAVGLESCDDHSHTHWMTRIPLKRRRACCQGVRELVPN